MIEFGGGKIRKLMTDTSFRHEFPERAKRDGHLSLPYAPIRDNLINIYFKWCEAVGITPDVRRKNLSRTSACSE